MNHQSYLRLKNALIQRRREVANSEEAADRLIDKLGIRDLIIPINSDTKKKPPSSKNATRKRAAQ